MDWLTQTDVIVRILGTVACGAGILACLVLLRIRFGGLQEGDVVRLGVVTVSATAFYKVLAATALVGLPAASVGLANYHVFEGVKEVESCNQCHVMRPMVTDMRDPGSMSLAARHARNGWISEQQCYSCHTDYGLAGTLKAKMDGYRHLARYTTGTYEEPITFRGVYSNHNCLHCHGGTDLFESVTSHRALRTRLADSDVSCTNCHGPAHPTRAERTPGHPAYDDLVGGER